MYTCLAQTDVLTGWKLAISTWTLYFIIYGCVNKVKLDISSQTLYCFKNVYVVYGNCLQTFLSESIEEDSFLCLSLPNHYLYVLSELCVCMYDLYVSGLERGRCVNVKCIKSLKLMLQGITVSKNSAWILVIPFVKGGKSWGVYFQLVRLVNVVTCHPCDVTPK